MELPCIGLAFTIRIFCKGISGFVTGCPCGVWYRGLATCSLYVGPICGKTILNKLVCKFGRMGKNFLLSQYIDNNHIYIYIHIG